MNLIISPKVNEKKKGKKSRVHLENSEKIPGQDDKIGSSTFISIPSEMKKLSMGKMKVYKESPLLDQLLSTNEMKELELEKDRAITFSSSRKQPIEDIHSTAKKIYKVYDEEQGINYLNQIYDQERLGQKALSRHARESQEQSRIQNQYENSISRIVYEARYPSKNLILTDEFRRLITSDFVARLINGNSTIKLLKFIFDKQGMPEMKELKYEISLNESLKKNILLQKNNAEIKRSNQSVCIIVVCLLLVLTAIFSSFCFFEIN